MGAGADPIAIDIGQGRWLKASGEIIGNFTPVIPPPPPNPPPVMGVDYSTTAPVEPNYYTDWQAQRVYRASYLSAVMAAYPNTKIIGLTDDANWNPEGGAATASQVRSALEGFYYSGGVYRSDRADVEIHVANGNEVDRDYKSASYPTLPTALINTWSAMYNVVHELNGDGSRRYPMAMMGVDLTVGNVNTDSSGVRFKAIAPYCDFFGCSLYPPGRSADPVVWTPYSSFLDGPLNAAKDWKDTYPNMKHFACWEVGSPIDAAKDDGTPNGWGQITDWTKRPAYFKGFMDYVYAGCNARGLWFREALYWNRQDNPDIPNQLKHDRYGLAQTTVPIDTVTVWHDYTP